MTKTPIPYIKSVAKTTLFMVLMFLFTPIKAQTYFHKYLKPLLSINIFQQTDNTYLLVAHTAIVNGGDPMDIIFIKLDSLGEVIYRKDISSSYIDANSYMIKKNDNIYIAGASGGGGDTGKVKFSKIDLEGNVIWHGRYGNQRNLAMYSKQFSIDQNNNIIGISHYPAVDTLKLSSFLYKVDSVGFFKWGKVLYHPNFKIGTGNIASSNDGSYFISSAYLPDSLSYGGTPTLIKLDNNGDFLWVKSFSIENGFDLKYAKTFVKSNGDVLLIGSYIDTLALEYRILFTILNPMGGVKSTNAISYNTSLSFITNNCIQTQDSGYAFVTQSGTWTTELFKLDKNLNVEWVKINNNVANVSNLLQTNDGGYIYSGQIPNLLVGNNPYIGIIKTDKYGNSGCFERDTMANTYPITVYDSVFTLQSYNEGFQSPSSTTEFFSSMQSYTHCFCSVTGGFTFTANGDTLEFTNTTTGASSYTWNFGDSNTSTDFSPTHVYDTSGTYNISLVVQDGICIDTVYATITIVGVKEEINPLNFSVYPNPSFSSNVQFTTTEQGTYQLKITDLTGKLIDNIAFTGKKYTYQSKHLSTGLYFYEITNENKVSSRGKLVKR